MRQMIRTMLVLLVVGLAGRAHAGDDKDKNKPAAPAKGDCPATVTSAIDKAFPGAAISSCKQEQEDGRTQFEVKLTKKDGGQLEVDVSTDGKILQVEEKIAVDALPAAVTKAFAAKYPKAKANRAEKQTHADGKVFYEVAFPDAAGRKGRKEATFAEDGTFVEEE